MRALIAETPGFDRANYRALFEHLERAPLPYLAERTGRDARLANGGAERSAAFRQDLAALGPKEFLALAHQGVALSGLIGCDLLARLLRRPRWTSGAGPNDAAAVVERACRTPEEREVIADCLAEAAAWIDHWAGLLAREGPFTHVIVERGASIAARSLQELAARAGARLFTVAPFLGAGHFYLEEGCGPLPGGSRLGAADYYERLALPADPDLRDRARAEAQRRWAELLRREAAPGQTQLEPRPFPPGDGKVVLVIGQALDDPAVLGTPTEEASILAQHRSLMEGLLEATSHRMLFVMPGTGRVSGHGGGRAALAALRAWREALPQDLRDRVRLREGEVPTDLLRHVDYAVGHSAPELLAACGVGLKPALFGAAFFGEKGFTGDHGSWEALLAAFAADRVDPDLDLQAFEAFETFLVRALLFHLVPNGDEGRDMVAQRLSEADGQPDYECAAFHFEAQSELAEVPLASLVRDVARNPLPWALMRFGRRR